MMGRIINLCNQLVQIESTIQALRENGSLSKPRRINRWVPEENMAETNESLLKFVNASGFLFQLRVEQEIKNLDGNWEIAACEHRWFDPQEENEGFIDLALKKGIIRMVVECKRVTDANWVFLVPNKKSDTESARTMWTMRQAPDKHIAEWHDFKISPVSSEATFCIVRGQGEKDTPMLERLSSLVLRSLESLAIEEFAFSERSDFQPRIYLPVIVTNAALNICRFDPSKINISTGQIDDAEFEPVPLVRFRKSLSSTMSSGKPQNSLEASNRSNERTIFIINSNHLAELLNKFDVSYQSNAPWPWEGVRKK